MKTRRLVQGVLAALLGAGIVACSGDDSTAPLMSVDSVGAMSFNLESLGKVVASYPLAPLSADETASLAFLREEEQMAQSVYRVSRELWATPVFRNMSDSEATHSAAVKVLLERYQQTDPLAGLSEGAFKTSAFQTLHDSLVASSRLSLVEALTVGLEIEELSLRDIAAQKENVDNADILKVYDNLFAASRNHLRAFAKTLVQQGGSYAPRYIPQSEFNAIVNGA
mgnify:CR=1 FL=1